MTTLKTTILTTWIVTVLLCSALLAQRPRILDSWRAQNERYSRELPEEVPDMAFNGWICPGTEGSWADVNNWSLGIVPISTHNVAFGSWSQASVVAGFNQTGVDLASLWTQPEYGGHIGTSANSLLIDSTKVTHEGSGLLHLKFDGHGGRVLIDSPNRMQAAILDGTASTCWINVKRGVVELAAGLSEVDVLNVSFHSSPGDDAIVTIPTSANTLGQVAINGGLVVNYRDIVDSGAGQEGVLSMGCGQLYMEGTSAAERVYVHGGHLINNSTGTFGVTTLLGGTCDATQKPGTRAMTIIRIFEGAEFYSSDLVTKTIYDYRNNAER